MHLLLHLHGASNVHQASMHLSKVPHSARVVRLVPTARVMGACLALSTRIRRHGGPVPAQFVLQVLFRPSKEQTVARGAAGCVPGARSTMPTVPPRHAVHVQEGPIQKQRDLSSACLVLKDTTPMNILQPATRRALHACQEQFLTQIQEDAVHVRRIHFGTRQFARHALMELVP